MHIHPAMQPKQIKSRFMFMVGMCSFLPILMPSNRWVERWDFLMSFLLVYIAVVAPVDTAFMRPKCAHPRRLRVCIVQSLNQFCVLFSVSTQLQPTVCSSIIQWLSSLYLL